MKRQKRISLLLALCLGLTLAGCRQGGGSGQDQQLEEYNAAVGYLNQAGQMVEQNVSRYAGYFGLEDEWTLVNEGSYLQNLSFTAENFPSLDVSLEAYQKISKDEELRAAIELQDQKVRALIEKGDEIAAHCAEKAYEGDGGVALQSLHKEFLQTLEDYDAAAGATNEKLGALESAISERELQQTLESELYIQHYSLKASLAVDNTLLALQSEDAGTASAALQEAKDALGQFDSYIADGKQVEKEGYQPQDLQQLSENAGRLLGALEDYIAGAGNESAVSQWYSSFVGSYNSAIYGAN